MGLVQWVWQKPASCPEALARSFCTLFITDHLRSPWCSSVTVMQPLMRGHAQADALPGLSPPPRPLLRAAPESRGHIISCDWGVVVFRPDDRDLSYRPRGRRPQRSCSDLASLCGALEPVQGELL